MEAEQTGASRKAEAWAYAIAAVTFVGLGVVLRTPILNFAIGPAYVIAVVTALKPLLTQRFSRQARP